MNNDIIILKEKYKLSPNKKTNDEFIQLLYDKFTLRLINNDNTTYLNKIEVLKRCCMQSSCNNGKFNYEELNIQTYEIIQDELSYKYYEKYNPNNLKFPPIYIMIETNTGYMDSNYNELLKQLILYKGISEIDIENNTDDLLLYLLMIDYFENKEN